jgi:hypothetical protein
MPRSDTAAVLVGTAFAAFEQHERCVAARQKVMRRRPGREAD